MTKVASVGTPIRRIEADTTVAFQSQLRRTEAEYLGMPGLSVTSTQAGRLWGVSTPTCALALLTLVNAGIMTRTPSGTFVLNKS